jgi:hypothetical protein
VEEFLITQLQEYGLFGVFMIMLYRQVPKIWSYLDNKESKQDAERERFIATLENINQHSERIAMDNQTSLHQIAATLDTHSESLRNISMVMINCNKGVNV